jgi:hypothetical protein
MYTPGASYCRQNLANGGVSTSVMINADNITKSYHNQSLNTLSVVYFTGVQVTPVLPLKIFL